VAVADEALVELAAESGNIDQVHEVVASKPVD
jgi:hypothetical protein